MQSIKKTSKLKAFLFFITLLALGAPLLFSAGRDLRAQELYPPGYMYDCGINLGECGSCESHDPTAKIFSHWYCSVPCDDMNIDPANDCVETTTCAVVSECADALFCGWDAGCGSCPPNEYGNVDPTTKWVTPIFCHETCANLTSACWWGPEYCEAASNCSLPVTCSYNEGCGTETDPDCPEYEARIVSYMCPEDYSCSLGSGNCEPNYINPDGYCVESSQCEGCVPQACVWEGCDWTTAGCPNGCGTHDNCFNLDPSKGEIVGASCTYPCPGGGGETTPTPAPTPINGTANVRAHVVSSTATTCAEVEAGAILPISIAITPEGTPIGAQSAAGGSYATWSVAGNQTYTLQDTPPSGYVLKLPCFNGGTGISAFVAGGATVTWELGYSLGTPWIQAQGGDVYAQTNISSFIPTAASLPYFSVNGTYGSAGLVQYGTDYDFSAAVGSKGDNLISVPAWLSQDVFPITDYYAVMYHRFGSPTVPDYPAGTTLASQLPSRATPYYVAGDLIISGTDWVVGAGQNIVVLVNGNLSIGNSINLSGGGFAAFIVNGNITVDPLVGVAWSSSTPVLEGVYITSPVGTFATGPSTSSGSERFVGRGIFVAGSFSMERNLDIVSHNVDTSSELFIYNPSLLLTMPDAMRDVPIMWQEVAP